MPHNQCNQVAPFGRWTGRFAPRALLQALCGLGPTSGSQAYRVLQPTGFLKNSILSNCGSVCRSSSLLPLLNSLMSMLLLAGGGGRARVYHLRCDD